MSLYFLIVFSVVGFQYQPLEFSQQNLKIKEALVKVQLWGILESAKPHRHKSLETGGTDIASLGSSKEKQFLKEFFYQKTDYFRPPHLSFFYRANFSRGPPHSLLS